MNIINAKTARNMATETILDSPAMEKIMMQIKEAVKAGKYSCEIALKEETRMSQYIRQQRPTIEPDYQRGEMSQELLEALTQLGYRIDDVRKSKASYYIENYISYEIFW